jgi:3-oxoacyl-[acyl-carrier-protein] synthase III
VPEFSSSDLLLLAIKNALDDADLDIKDVDGLICRGPHDVYNHHQVIGSKLGINACFSTTLDNGAPDKLLASSSPF